MKGSDLSAGSAQGHRRLAQASWLVRCRNSGGGIRKSEWLAAAKNRFGRTVQAVGRPVGRSHPKKKNSILKGMTLGRVLFRHPAPPRLSCPATRGRSCWWWS